MGINTTLESASTTAASNGPSGSDQRTVADDALRQYLSFIKSLKTLATLASNTTVTPPSTANAFSVTGTTAITTIASTNSWDGRDILFIFAGILTFTHGSNLILPGAANITTAAGDAAWMIQIASGQWRCVNYTRADNSMAVAALSATDLTTTGNTILGNAQADTLNVGNGDIVKDGSGNVGIGTSPSVKFHVKGSAATGRVRAESTGGVVGEMQPDGNTSFVLGAISNHQLDLIANSTVRMTLVNDGRIYATGIHNNAGAMTGTTNQYIGSGTYTPTLTDTSNITTSTPAICQWIRVGNVVTVSGQVNVTPTAAAGWILGVSLPIASDLATAAQLAGSGTRDRSVGGSGSWVSIQGDVTNNRALFDGGGDSVTDLPHFFTFTYLIV